MTVGMATGLVAIAKFALNFRGRITTSAGTLSTRGSLLDSDMARRETGGLVDNVIVPVVLAPPITVVESNDRENPPSVGLTWSGCFASLSDEVLRAPLI